MLSKAYISYVSLMHFHHEIPGREYQIYLSPMRPQCILIHHKCVLKTTLASAYPYILQSLQILMN